MKTATTALHDLSVGERVEGGETPDDYDTGVVVGADGSLVAVVWDSGVTTEQEASVLRPEGSRPISAADGDE